jgi:S-adenosylmethionine:tRNA ribosyltransferase-isomerase
VKTEKLQYRLPEELIAQQPARIRSNSRLLVLNRTTNELVDSQFSKVGEFLRPGDCLVTNDTKVLPARFFARRGSGGKLEGLFLLESSPGIWEVMLKGARKVRIGERFYLTNREKNNSFEAELLDKTAAGRCRLKIDGDAKTVLNEIGFPPLPPYIKRDDDPVQAAIDKRRYQTVFAREAGAVAAPTAGLHFTKRLMQQLKEGGVCFAHIILHVGTGTFKPITAENLEDHEMHQERFSIDEKNVRIINAAKRKGSRIVAVGTTTVRALETVAGGSQLRAKSGTTELFIKPGYEFKIIDAMITNFHLPKSTLLAMVAAFAGLEEILAAYRHAVEQRYRFYSYGDAMLII